MGWYDVRDGKQLAQRIASNGHVFGLFTRMPALEVVEICGHAGCDFVIVDREHGPIGWERTAAMVAAAENVGITPLVRVSRGTRDLISRALDTGAHGVMVPQIESAGAARDAVAATRYGVDGTRGSAGNPRNGYGLVMGYADYMPAANAATFVVIQVESSAAVENVEEIAAVEGIDCLFVGLTDLSVDLGHPGEYEHPEVDSCLDRVFAAAAENEVPVGVPVADPGMANRYLSRGAALVATGDTGLFARSVAGFVEEMG